MKTFATIVMLLASLQGCAPGSDCLEGKSCTGSHAGGADGDDADGGAGAAGANAPMCTVFGRAHLGLGGTDLAATDDGPPGGDRARAKPYSALLTEYGRVLGSSPSSLASAGATFGIAQDRWYFEPIASAVFVTTAFDVAFEGCNSLTGADARFAAVPTEATAQPVCADWIRKAWSREGTPDAISACVSVAMSTTEETYGRPGVDETTRPATPARRWAYACASVLSATGFLTF